MILVNYRYINPIFFPFDLLWKFQMVCNHLAYYHKLEAHNSLSPLHDINRFIIDIPELELEPNKTWVIYNTIASKFFTWFLGEFVPNTAYFKLWTIYKGSKSIEHGDLNLNLHITILIHVIFRHVLLCSLCQSMDPKTLTTYRP
jgi:hypothetical protein